MSNIITEKYTEAATRYSDIYRHVPRLNKIATECDSIIEMGTRGAVSTWAFVEANPEKLTCIDLHRTAAVDELDSILKNSGINFNFLQANTLKIEVDECDLIFIDTLHTYIQLREELRLHGNKAKKYLAFHDTTTFGHTSENGDKQRGLVDAIDEFLESNPHWSRHEVYEDNNGLTILKRKQPGNSKFGIASFCIFERYRKQAIENLIQSCPSNIEIVLGTDDPTAFEEFDNVKAFNMNKYVDTSSISEKYFEFDFSIKRFALKEARLYGFDKILLCDCDTVIKDQAVPLMNAVGPIKDINTITGFSGVYKNDIDRVNRTRTAAYLKTLNYSVEDYLESQPIVSEDLQQLFYVDDATFDAFLEHLGQLFEYRKNNKMDESFRGVLTEISIAAYMAGIRTNPLNMPSGLTANHDKWYAK